MGLAWLDQARPCDVRHVMRSNLFQKREGYHDCSRMLVTNHYSAGVKPNFWNRAISYWKGRAEHACRDEQAAHLRGDRCLARRLTGSGRWPRSAASPPARWP